MLPAGRLCLHTPRADCNEKRPRLSACSMPLPPHAPCRLQLYDAIKAYPGKVFASTRPVQIATYEEIAGGANIDLCLHTPRADCNRDCAGEKSQKARLCLHTPRADCNASPLSSSILRMLCLHTPRADCNALRPSRLFLPQPLPPHAPCRLQRQKCTELQYALFRTCVESVDSFSVLNKAMLR